ncbi:uncharacterized protein ACOB8E_002045 [Sarcophilus harrisii]
MNRGGKRSRKRETTAPKKHKSRQVTALLRLEFKYPQRADKSGLSSPGRPPPDVSKHDQPKEKKLTQRAGRPSPTDRCACWGLPGNRHLFALSPSQAGEPAPSPAPTSGYLCPGRGDPLPNPVRFFLSLPAGGFKPAPSPPPSWLESGAAKPQDRVATAWAALGPPSQASYLILHNRRLSTKLRSRHSGTQFGIIEKVIDTEQALYKSFGLTVDPKEGHVHQN